MKFTIRILLAAAAFGGLVRADTIALVAPPATLTGITSGNVLGIADDNYVNNFPVSTNYMHADDTSASFDNTAIPDNLYGLPLLHTKQADRTSTGDTTVVTTTLSAYSQVCVAHSDLELTKPTWLDTNYSDTGIDIAMPTPSSLFCRLATAGTVNFGGNCKTGGCDSVNSPMYLVMLVPPHRPIRGIVETPPDPVDPPTDPPGELHFCDSQYTANESTTLTFWICRTGGSAGAASVQIAEGTNPANGVLNTFSRSWTDGSSSPRQGTVTLADVVGNSIMTLDLSTFVGATPGVPISVTINITDVGGSGGTPPAAGDYYVNPTTTCSDAYVGQSRTFVSGTNGPWCSANKCNTITAAASGHRTCWLEGAGSGTGLVYDTNNILSFANSGVNSTRTLRVCAIGGNVRLINAGSYIENIIVAATDYTQYGGCDLTAILHYDGGVAFGTNCSKGDNPVDCGRIRSGLNISGDHNTFGVQQNNTGGWSGVFAETSATDTRFVAPFALNGPHGSPFVPNETDGTVNEDSGDPLQVWRDAPNVSTLLDGCVAGSSGILNKLGGHAMASWWSGQILQRCLQENNDWSGVPTFGSTNGIPDGNRGSSYTQQAHDSVSHDYVMNRSGRPADHPWTECFKHEGQYNTVVVAVIRNCVGLGVQGEARAGTHYMREQVVAHTVFERIGSIMFHMNDLSGWGLTGHSGNPLAPMEKLYFKNIILRLWTQDPQCCNGKPPGLYSPNVQDSLFVITFGANTGKTFADTVFMDGWTIQHPSGSCNSVYIYMYNGPHSGKRSLTEMMALYPNNIRNVVCTTDANLDTAPAAATNILPHQIANYYLPVSDSLSVAAGSHLTYATSAGVGSTQLNVENVLYFPDPISDTDGSAWGAPAIGQFAGAYQVHIGGVGNVTYTDRVRTAGQHSGYLTLASPQTWNSNANVNLKISSGGVNATPNKGAVLFMVPPVLWPRRRRTSAEPRRRVA